MAATLPTGEQYEITSGPFSAVVTEVGATLRAFSVGGAPVLRGFAVDALPRGSAGQQLVPWPNRVADGTYEFGGATQQLALTEPARHNAIHGLVRYVPWRLVELAESSVTQEVRVFPQLGWPGVLDATLTQSLSGEGLRVELTARNVGAVPVPFGYGAHPYFTVGETSVDDVSVTAPAASYLEVDDRLLPIAVRPVAGTDYDLRGGEVLGVRTFDTAFTDIDRGTDGRWRVRLERGERFAELWADENFGWLQVFTGNDARDWSMAVEPMTCGPDAFNEGPTHDGMITLDPGDEFRGAWGVTGA